MHGAGQEQTGALAVEFKGALFVDIALDAIRATDAIFDAELEVFENSSHFFLMEEAEKALATIKDWLAKNTP